jgi:hypothetical protein
MVLQKLWKKMYKYLKHIEYMQKKSKISIWANIEEAHISEYVLIAKGASILNSYIGQYTSVGRNTKISNSIVGKFNSISWDATIGATSHPLKNVSTHAFAYVPYVGNFVSTRNQLIKECRLGNDVWIGCHSVILPGVEIGDGAVVGAGAVVTKNVPPYAIVVGVPAKVIRYRFSDEIIKQLQYIKWWDWPRHIIKENIYLFQQELNKDLLNKMYDIGKSIL